MAFVMWWAYGCKRYGIPETLLLAIPNGGARHIAVARKLKAEGVRAGVSDYLLAVPRGVYHGLFLELKAGGPGIPKGRVSKEQMAFGDTVRAQWYSFGVAYGTDEAINLVDMYLMTGAKA